MTRTLAAAALAALCSATLSGCAWTLISAADAAGSLVQAGYTVAANYSSPTYVTGEPVALRTVCIELNQTVATGDFVPALQIALHKRGVNSMVYNPGTSPPGCEALLSYAATTDWDHRSFSDEWTAYISAINLTLLQRGRVLVTARYETHGLNVDRFSSASQKVSALIDKMVVAQVD